MVSRIRIEIVDEGWSRVYMDDELACQDIRVTVIDILRAIESRMQSQSHMNFELEIIQVEEPE